VKAIGVSRTTLYALRDEGAIEFTKIGGRTVIRADELRRFLAAQPPMPRRGSDE
jgi:excisionase family DNA binding protein